MIDSIIMKNQQDLMLNIVKEKNHFMIKPHNINLHPDNMLFLDQTVKCLQESLLKKHVDSIQIKIFCISVLHVKFNVFVHNVSFMVNIIFILIGKHKDHDVKTIKKAHPLIKS
jgi:hypothetical protein